LRVGPVPVRTNQNQLNLPGSGWLSADFLKTQKQKNGIIKTRTWTHFLDNPYYTGCLFLAFKICLEAHTGRTKGARVSYR
jgi:hypothetical protein